MALTRKMLKAMGITDEQIDTIIEAHTETTSALKDDIEKYKSESDKYKTDSTRIAEIQKQLDDANADVAKYKAEAEKNSKAQEEFDAYKASIAAEAVKSTKIKAIETVLKSGKMSDKGIELLTKYQNLDEIEVDETGKMKDADKYLASAKAGDFGGYFPTESTVGTTTPNPAGNNAPATKAKTIDEIMKIENTTERQKELAKMLESKAAERKDG